MPKPYPKEFREDVWVPKIGSWPGGCRADELPAVGAGNCVLAGHAAFRYSLMSLSQRVDLTVCRDGGGGPGVASRYDQRGVSRPQGPGCDKGAVEVQVAVSVAPVPAAPVTAAPLFTG